MPQTAQRFRYRPPRPRAGILATALFLGALALSATTAPLIASAPARSGARAIGQPATAHDAYADRAVAPASRPPT